MPRTAITDLSVYKDKEATPLQEAFADWITDEVGVAYGTQKEVTAFRDGVRLAQALIMRFQAARRDGSVETPAREVEEAPVAKPAKAKPAKKAAAKAAPVEDDDEPAAVPAKPAKRGRRPAKAAAPEVDAPF